MVARTVGGPARSVITVTNREGFPIYIGSCSVWIQSPAGPEWRVSYAPSCGGPTVALDPGASHVREYPAFDQGTYRPVVAYRESPESDEIEVHGSPIEW